MATKGARKVSGIYPRGNIFWLSFQKKGKRHWVSLETGDYGEAVRRAGLIRERPEVLPSFGLKGEIDTFIRHKIDHREYTASTAESKQPVLNKFAKFIGNVTPPDVTLPMIQAYYADLRKERSASTCNGYIMSVRAFFNWCVETGRVRRNPCEGLKLVEAKGGVRLDFCTKSLRDKLIAECPREDLRLILFCGFHAGLRKQEIVEARPFWFDMDAKQLHLRKTETMNFKDGEERSIPMTRDFHTFLVGYGLRGPFMLHPEVKKGNSLYRYDFRRPFTEYMAAQGVPWVTPHVMRHTFASLLASAGRSIYMVAQWLGDDVRVVQKHYAKLTPLHDQIEI